MCSSDLESMEIWEEDEAKENQEEVEPGPEQEVSIHHNDGYNGMAFTGTVRQALDVARTLRPMIDAQGPGETPNWLSDFVFQLEILGKEPDVMDPDDEG